MNQNRDVWFDPRSVPIPQEPKFGSVLRSYSSRTEVTWLVQFDSRLIKLTESTTNSTQLVF